jgi:L-lactate dehydrogenase complex protein LldG
MNQDLPETSDAGTAGPGVQEHLIEAFSARLISVSGKVSVVDSLEEAAAIIARSAVQTTTGRYLMTRAVLDDFPHLPRYLVAEGVSLRLAEVVAEEVAGTSELAAAIAGDIGIVAAIAGVAETGSVLGSDDTPAARLTGMLADTVFVLLKAGNIVPTLDDLSPVMQALNAQGRYYLSLVTGPSRTADIERVLTIGVQGPKELYVIVLRET